VTVFINGRFVRRDRASVSVFDRGFLYGDGLFETMRVHQGRLFVPALHLRRLKAGAEFLRIEIPLTLRELDRFARELVRRNRARDAVLRVNLSRGIGLRGYGPSGNETPTVVMSLHVAARPEEEPTVRRLATSSHRVNAGDPLLRHKTSNKLAHVLACAEAADAGADEALLLNTDGHVAEAASANVFWIRGREVRTPALDCGALPGITRGLVMEWSAALGLRVRECHAKPRELVAADAVFITLSSMGVVEAVSLDGRRLKRSPIVARLREAWRDALRRV
jgi:aminodeoxychorismate lyase